MMGDRRLLVVGAGLLGSAVARQAHERGWAVTVATRRSYQPGVRQVDTSHLHGAARLREILVAERPDAVVLAHGPATTAACRADPPGALRAHETSAEVVAATELRTVLVSTDAVFPGQKDRYGPDDECGPTNIYGRAKHAAELAAARGGNVSILRLSLLYGTRAMPTRGELGFVEQAMAQLRDGEVVTAPTDQFTTPLWVEDAAEAVLLMVDAAAPGRVVHAAGPTRWSRHGIVCEAADALGVDRGLVRGVLRRDSVWADRPPSSCLVDTVRSEFPASGWRPLDVPTGLRRLLAHA
jgi:dTDP-4-dehydrorhamnose reductase